MKGPMIKRDLRLKLVGHLLERGGQRVIRDLNRTTRCLRCHDRLDMSTDAMTGEVVEECLRCGMRQPVPRFRPEDEEGPAA
jgi:hypothetical protein